MLLEQVDAPNVVELRNHPPSPRDVEVLEVG